MATVLSHAIAAIALKTAFAADKVPRRLWLLGAVCSMAPDIDVLGFRFDIAYGDLFGHRGFTHSLFFAGFLGLLGTFAAFPRRTSGAHRGIVWIYLFLATASHGLLDALTDGGHGIAFFAPFENSRYFFPVNSIEVSPIGLSGFFSSGGAGPCERGSVDLATIASLCRSGVATQVISRPPSRFSNRRLISLLTPLAI